MERNSVSEEIFTAADSPRDEPRRLPKKQSQCARASDMIVVGQKWMETQMQDIFIFIASPELFVHRDKWDFQMEVLCRCSE